MFHIHRRDCARPWVWYPYTLQHLYERTRRGRMEDCPEACTTGFLNGAKSLIYRVFGSSVVEGACTPR